MSAPPGWFQDPQRPPGHLRWWDGERWSEHRTVAPGAPGSSAASWPARHPWLTAAAALCALLLFAGIAGAGSEGSDDGTVDATGEEDTPVSRADGAGPEDEAADSSPAGREPRSVPEPEEEREPREYLVTRIVDGDTLELGNGEVVRLAGIDAPEAGTCGSERAAQTLARLVLGKAVRLGESDEDRDGYGRLLRYVDIGNQDAGLRLLKNGLAIARYDSRDGYGFHPREPLYIAVDKRTKQVGCATPQPFAPQQPTGDCAGYNPCIPSYPPDLDCADVDGPITVTGSDPHGLDADHDGVACE